MRARMAGGGRSPATRRAPAPAIPRARRGRPGRRGAAAPRHPPARDGRRPGGGGPRRARPAGGCAPALDRVRRSPVRRGRLRGRARCRDPARPADGTVVATLAAQGAVPLDHSYRLDDGARVRAVLPRHGRVAVHGRAGARRGPAAIRQISHRPWRARIVDPRRSQISWTYCGSMLRRSGVSFVTGSGRPTWSRHFPAHAPPLAFALFSHSLLSTSSAHAPHTRPARPRHIPPPRR